MVWSELLPVWIEHWDIYARTMGEKIIQYLFTVLFVFLLFVFTLITVIQNLAIKVDLVTLSATNEFNPSRPDPEWGEKINVNFYFHTL